jgi:membrane protease YdiL (CAAX protease family)
VTGPGSDGRLTGNGRLPERTGSGVTEDPGLGVAGQRAPSEGEEPPRPTGPLTPEGVRWDMPDAEEQPETESPSGPPGGGIFSLEGRRAPGLYLVSWLLSVAGLVLLFLIGPLASAEGARLLLVSAGAVILTLGLAAGCGYQVLERRVRDPDRYRGPSPLLVFLTYFMAFAVIGLVVSPDGKIDDLDPVVFLTLGSLQTLGYLVIVWLFVVRTGALPWRAMGWPAWPDRNPRPVLRAVAEAVVVMVPVTFGLAILGGILARVLQVEAPDVLPTPGNPVEALAIAAAAALIMPIGEESFFRGFSLTAWWRDLGPRSALLRSSVFFAFVHAANIRNDFLQGFLQFVLQTAVILPVGLVLGWLFLRRGMAASITGHFTYNGLLLVLWLVAATLPQTT